MTNLVSNSPQPAKRAFSVPEAAALVGIGRTVLFREMQEGRLKRVKIGRRTLIRATDLDDWLEALEG